MTTGRLYGKRVLITGAASGIGLACARQMAREGAQILLTDITIEAGEAAARAIGPSARFRHLDVSEEQDWERAADTVPRLLGGLDILVNNAGMGIGGDITRLALKDWRRQQAVILDGAFLA